MSAVSKPIPLEIDVKGKVVFRLHNDGTIEADWARIEEHARLLFSVAARDDSVILCAALVGVAQQIKDECGSRNPG